MNAPHVNVDLVKVIRQFLGKEEIAGFFLFLKFLDEIIQGHSAFLSFSFWETLIKNPWTKQRLSVGS